MHFPRRADRLVVPTVQLQHLRHGVPEAGSDPHLQLHALQPDCEREGQEPGVRLLRPFMSRQERPDVPANHHHAAVAVRRTRVHVLAVVQRAADQRRWAIVAHQFGH